MKILLLGGGLQGLSCAESLTSVGYSVSSISKELDIERSSLFEKTYTESLNESSLFEILKREHYDVLIPMGDVAASFLSDIKEKVEQTFPTRCAVPASRLLSIVLDKKNFMAFCKDNQIPHPKTFPLSSSNLNTASAEIGFPALIKPDYSVGARGITRVNSYEDLRKWVDPISQKYGSCTLQEYIDNPDYYYNVMMYRDKYGNCDNCVVIKILRMYPIGGGSSSYCVSVKNEELCGICKSVLDKLNWVGMADFDVLQRKDTLEYKIIEINPRVPASVRAAFVSGVNFPEIIVRKAMGLPVESYDYRPGKVLRYMGLDLMWFIKSPDRFKHLSSWLHFFGKDIYYQDILKSDRSTWSSWFMEGLKKMKRKNKRIR
jgi:carbamoylphosphate synthase large subunit